MILGYSRCLTETTHAQPKNSCVSRLFDTEGATFRNYRSIYRQLCIMHCALNKPQSPPPASKNNLILSEQSERFNFSPQAIHPASIANCALCIVLCALIKSEWLQNQHLMRNYLIVFNCRLRKKTQNCPKTSVFDQKTAQSWSIFPEKNTKLSHRPHSGSNNFSAKHHYNFSEALISTPPGVAKHSHRPLPNKSLCQLFVPTRSQKYSCVSRLFDTYRCNFLRLSNPPATWYIWGMCIKWVRRTYNL